MAEKNSFTLSWKKAAADVLLIVVGVSIALAADSWLADRTEKNRTNELLDALEAEWTEELARIDTSVHELGVAKIAIIQMIKTHSDAPGETSRAEAATLMMATGWSTFKPSDGALSTLMVDGVQDIEDDSLRLAVASWRTVLDELTAGQSALRELGTLRERSIASRIAQDSGVKISGEEAEYGYWSYGMELGAFSLAAIADDEWIAMQRHLVNLLNDYQTQLISVRDILERNLTLLSERKNN